MKTTSTIHFLFLLALLFGLSLSSQGQAVTIQENTLGFCSVDGLIVTSVAGYTGTGYADGDRGIGKSMKWSIHVAAPTQVSLTWRFANGGGSGARNAQLQIDDLTVKDTLAFVHTGTWTAWQMTGVFTLNLEAGKHTIRLLSYSVDGLANIDYLLAEGTGVSAASCVPSYYLKVNKNNDQGTVWYTPVQPFYDEGTVVTLHANVKAGYFFQSWSGDATSADSVYTFAIKRNTETTALFLPNGTVAETGVIGYATVQDDKGTPYLITGGKGGQVVTATTLPELKAYLASAEPLVVQVDRQIVGAEVISIHSNKTLIGINESAHLMGIQVDINNGASNVIMKQLKISHVIAAAGIGDAISINGKANHIWIDHCELFSDRDHGKDYYDGLLDMKNQASFVTVSWCKFHDHDKAILLASNDESPLDSVARITFHHNHFQNCGSRLPSVRFGKAHIFNNYFANSDDAVSSRMGACLRIEENYFDNVGTAVMTNQSVATGKVQILDNHFGDAQVATSPTCTLAVPYEYLSVLQDKDELPSIVTSLKSEERSVVRSFLSVSPNPASHMATLHFELKATSQVQLVVQDAAGREVVQMEERTMPKGLQQIDLATGALPQGIYTCKLQADGTAHVIKMVVGK